MSEDDWQQRVTEAATLHGWMWMHVNRATVRQGRRHITPTSLPGWPDLVLWHEARRLMLFVELKSDTGSVDPAQDRVLSSLGEAGARVYVWRPRDWTRLLGILAGDAQTEEDQLWLDAEVRHERTQDAASGGTE